MELIPNRKRRVPMVRKPSIAEGHDYFHDDWSWFVYGYMQVPISRLIFLFPSAVRDKVWRDVAEGVSPKVLANRGYVDLSGVERTQHKWWWKLIRTESAIMDKGGDVRDLGDCPKAGHR